MTVRTVTSESRQQWDFWFDNATDLSVDAKFAFMDEVAAFTRDGRMTVEEGERLLRLFDAISDHQWTMGYAMGMRRAVSVYVDGA